MSHHSDTHSSRSARSRRRRHHHARSHTSSSYITREPKPIPQPEPEHIPIGHVWDLIVRKYKSPKTKELTAGQREQKKPFSAVTVAVENLTSESYEEDDLSGIPDLVEAIKLQATGPAEAARAIRKKLKYGNIHRQIRALTILDGLIQNAGARFQRTFADEMLLERLRICGTSDLTDPLVRDKCKELFRSWAAEYKNVRGLEQIASLYKQLPRTKKVVTQDRSQVLRETEQNPFHVDEDEEPAPAGPSHSRQSSLATSSRERAASIMSGTAKKSKKDKEQDKKRKHKPFNLAAEKETMKAAIAESSVASTNLLNALRHINREKERISENKAAQTHFDACKLLRRKILRYIQYVETEDWLGALLHANDELVTALMTYEQLDRSIDADSDSDDELAEQQHMYKCKQQMSNLNLGPKSPLSPTFSSHRPAPPTPVQSHHHAAPEPEEEEEEEDENDPFADRNALDTPATEKPQPAW
ncbi:vhs domain-containing protein [Rutstroemia sp. NJR-2017a BBW]|nr:vhs domain-containing protein [Rutstroemia sp. NJR-2017a BBW]